MPSTAVAFSITPSGAAVLTNQRAADDSTKPVKFDAAFIERRMREHKAMMRRLEAEAEQAIINEVLAIYAREPRQ